MASVSAASALPTTAGMPATNVTAAMTTSAATESAASPVAPAVAGGVAIIVQAAVGIIGVVVIAIG